MIRAPRRLVTGLALVALAALALWATSHLGQGTLRVMGPAMFPRWLAVLIGGSGAVMVALSLARDGAPLERLPLRGPLFVGAGILLFALTIRVFGLAVAGPLAVFVGGLAAPDVRPKELALFALLLTGFSIVVFHVLLKLAMPILIVPGTSIAL